MQARPTRPRCWFAILPVLLDLEYVPEQSLVLDTRDIDEAIVKS